jgi:hypothetical protein
VRSPAPQTLDLGTAKKDGRIRDVAEFSQQEIRDRTDASRRDGFLVTKLRLVTHPPAAAPLPLNESRIETTDAKQCVEKGPP